MRSDQPHLPSAAQTPASPGWVVGLHSGVGLWVVSLVYKQNTASSTFWERQLLSEACLSGNHLPACRLCKVPGVHSMDGYGFVLEVHGAGAVGARGCQADAARGGRICPWRTDLGWTPHSVPGAAPPPLLCSRCPLVWPQWF